jgi:outer membrane protein assembly factor BamA
MRVLSCVARPYCFVASLLLLAIAPLRAQTGAAGKSFTLTSATFVGAKRFTQEQLFAASGLRKGQQIDVPGIDAAADRLFKTGTLANIAYSFRMTGANIDVQFKLAEATKFFPCTYDNFVWFRDDELTAAVRQAVPLFDGSLPVGGELANQVTDALEHFLQEHAIKASVTALMSSSRMGEAPSMYQIRAADVSIPVAAVNVKGGPLGPAALANATRVLTGTDYSRSIARGAGQTGLTEAYQDEGYLQAKFSDPQIVMKDPQGHDASLGVTILYDVVPGPLYNWNGITWTGNQAVPETELTQLLGFKPGDIARRDKMNEGLASIHKRYGKDGYLALQIADTPEFDVVQHQVHYQAKIVEGPQYHMGAFTATGVTEIVANKLKEAWKLRPGQVFDTSYENTFATKDMLQVMRPSVESRFTLTFHRKIDSQSHVVDVELEIK